MKLDLDLNELIQLRGALIEKRDRLKETNKADKSMNSLLNADSIETIDTILDKLNKLCNE